MNEWIKYDNGIYAHVLPDESMPLKSLKTFYDVIDSQSFVQTGQLTDYGQLMMNDKDHSKLLKMIKANQPENEKRSKLRRFQIEAEWQRTAPLPCSYLPEGYVYLITTVGDVHDMFKYLITCDEDSLISFLELKGE